MTDPTLLPLRAAERAGRLFVWVKQLDLSRQEFAVLSHLIYVSDEHLSSHWSVAKIGEAVDYSTRIVSDTLRLLEAKRLIERQQRERANRSKTSSRVLVLAPPEVARLRTVEPDLAAVEHDGDLDYRLSMGSADIADGVSAAFADLEPSSIGKEYLEREEGSSAVFADTPRRRRRACGPVPFAAIADELTRAAA